ncbi:MAG: hypothetical protein DSM106950_20480 [Stigonema ocellatum SAG 48.90 = DSM 106950]|nr:hypothetical protein [Stigonema ocellatum SAG 48.90 = DSM 106950]
MNIKRLTSVITAASILAFSGLWESALARTIQLKPYPVNALDLALNIPLPQELDINISHVTKAQNIISINNGQKEIDKNVSLKDTYRGKFKAVYIPAKTASSKVWQDLFQKSELYEKIANGFNKIFIIPRDITIVSAECGSPNAFYSENKHAIIMCYELVEKLGKFNAHYATSKEEWYKTTTLSLAFILMHEMGHTLIHELNLPVLGREEDAADQLSAILFSHGSSNMEIGVAAIANFLKENAQGAEKLHFWDEHPLNAQRYYNIICWFYGSNPSKYATLPTFSGLPGKRAKGCPSEYKQAYYSWTRLLQPYVIQGKI